MVRTIRSGNARWKRLGLRAGTFMSFTQNASNAMSGREGPGYVAVPLL